MNPSEFISPELPGYVEFSTGSRDIPAIFDMEYIETNNISGIKPTLLCTYENSQLINEGDSISVDSKNYLLEIIQEQDEFFALLVLRRT